MAFTRFLAPRRLLAKVDTSGFPHAPFRPFPPFPPGSGDRLCFFCTFRVMTAKPSSMVQRCKVYNVVHPTIFTEVMPEVGDLIGLSRLHRPILMVFVREGGYGVLTIQVLRMSVQLECAFCGPLHSDRSICQENGPSAVPFMPWTFATWNPSSWRELDQSAENCKCRTRHRHHPPSRDVSQIPQSHKL